MNRISKYILKKKNGTCIEAKSPGGNRKNQNCSKKGERGNTGCKGKKKCPVDVRLKTKGGRVQKFTRGRRERGEEKPTEVVAFEEGRGESNSLALEVGPDGTKDRPSGARGSRGRSAKVVHKKDQKRGTFCFMCERFKARSWERCFTCGCERGEVRTGKGVNQLGGGGSLTGEG